MPKPVFLIFELAMYGVLALCLRHALACGRALELLAGVSYGVLLEIATILQLQGYHYGRFLIMFGEVPLCLGVGWGVILYSAMATSDGWNVLPTQRPFVDALLAWNIDLSMDAIAIRLGFWTWHGYGRWFGVPRANFFAWYVVVASFSAFSRWLRSWQNRRGLRWIYPFVAILLSLATLLTLDMLYVEYAFRPYDVQWLALSGLLLLSLLALWTSRRSLRWPQKVDWPIVSVPLVFHLLFTGALLWAGFCRQIPVLLLVSLAMLILGLAVHLAPLVSAQFRPRSDVNAG
jgi:uncharacterized membrane protein